MTIESGDSLSIDRKERVNLPYLGLDVRSAVERIHDFKDVVIRFDDQRARYEAKRCIHCPDPIPCVVACPVHNQIPSAMWQIENGNYLEAARIFRDTSIMPEICGRVCPQEILCQGSCVLNHDSTPVLIGASEVFCTDYEWRVQPPQFTPGASTGKRVAVIGGGPAGLACAVRLIEAGHKVTVFDARPLPGGLLMYGIPGFKLESEILDLKIQQLMKAGIRFIVNTYVGKDLMLDDLLASGFDAVFIGIGAELDASMHIPGEDLPGVYKAAEFLIRANVEPDKLPADLRGKPEIGERVVVIGGGDTSSDCLRTSLRLGVKELTCVYRRTFDLMPGSKKDRGLAREEGAKYLFETQPVRFIAGENGKLAAIECVKMQLGEPDARGRRRPVPIPNSNFTFPVDTAVMAVGFFAYPAIGETTPGLVTHDEGLIIANPETGVTSRSEIYAGGDAVNGPDLVVTAVADGQRAAKAIDEYLRSIDQR